ncbi:MAG TPA: sensor histidine kinase [Flavipsychrobacter sp.]|nr:sensor histidine kinase [Flavipsychrobacter sp.]
MKRLIVILFVLVSVTHSFGQRQRIDSLLGAIKGALPDTMRMRVHYQLAKDYLHISGDSSIYYAGSSLAFAKKFKRVKIEAESYALLGTNEKNKGNYEKALSYHLAALKIKESNKDDHGLAITHNDIGVLYKIMGRYDEALENYKRSNELCKKAGVEKGIAMTYNNIGTIYREKRKPDSALYYYQLGLQQSEKIGDSYSIATCLSNIGDIYTEKERDAEALVIFMRCLTYDKTNEDKTGMVVSYNNISRALGTLKRFDEAFRYSDSAIALTLAEQLNQERINTYSIRSVVEEWSGDTKEALFYHRKLTALKDSLMNAETNQQISELQTKYETEKKEQQIALQQSELKKKNYLIGGAVGVFALCMLLFYSYYRRYKLQQRTHLQKEIIRQQELATHAVIEAEERERKRIASDLHDGVGQVMSAAKMNLSLVGSELSFTNEEQKHTFEKAMALVDDGCREVRTVSHNIMPNALLKSGLSSAIREFINKIDQRVIKVNLYTEGLNERIDGKTESVLYRIVQECVNNVIKHAGATQLDISLIKEENEISLTIEDNGKGFDTSDKSKFEGIGIKNIQSRVDYLKGTVEWDAAPGKGSVVMVHVPHS